MSKKTEQAVIRAAMRESLTDLAREGPYAWTGTVSERLKQLARFSSPMRAARLRACAAHAKSKKEKR